MDILEKNGKIEDQLLIIDKIQKVYNEKSLPTPPSGKRDGN